MEVNFGASVNFNIFPKIEIWKSEGESKVTDFKLTYPSNPDFWEEGDILKCTINTLP